MDALTSLLATLCLFCLTCCPPAGAAVNTNNVLSLNTATTNVTTGAYVVLSSSIVVSPAKLVIVNNTSSVIKLAYGLAGSETDFVSVAPSWMEVIPLEKHFPMGTRLVVEAVSGTASTGYISVSLIP
jgi:hypothetical protein